eukprot:g36978.t1
MTRARRRAVARHRVRPTGRADPRVLRARLGFANANIFLQSQKKKVPERKFPKNMPQEIFSQCFFKPLSKCQKHSPLAEATVDLKSVNSGSIYGKSLNPKKEQDVLA